MSSYYDGGITNQGGEGSVSGSNPALSKKSFDDGLWKNGFDYQSYEPNGNAGFNTINTSIMFNADYQVAFSDANATVESTIKTTIRNTTVLPVYSDWEENDQTFRHLYGLSSFTFKATGVSKTTKNIRIIENTNGQRVNPNDLNNKSIVVLGKQVVNRQNSVFYDAPPAGIAGFGDVSHNAQRAHASIEIVSEGAVFADSQKLTSPFSPSPYCGFTEENSAKILKGCLSFYPTQKCFGFGEQEGTTKWKPNVSNIASGYSTVILATYSSLIDSEVSFRSATYSLYLRKPIEGSGITKAFSTHYVGSDFGIKINSLTNFANLPESRFANTPVYEWTDDNGLTTQNFYCDDEDSPRTICLLNPAKYTLRTMQGSEIGGETIRIVSVGAYSSVFGSGKNIALTMEPILFVETGNEDILALGVAKKFYNQRYRWISDTDAISRQETSCPVFTNTNSSTN
jgi:hypothetical protein